MEEKVKIIPIRTVVILFFIILMLLFVSIYTSLAAFKINYEQQDVAVIKVKDITPTIELGGSYENVILNEDNYSLEINIPQKTKTFVNIKLNNSENINVKYKLYYKNNIQILENNIGISSKSEDIASGTINSQKTKNWIVL